MKRFMRTVLSVFVVICCFALTSCKTPATNYTYVALVNNSTGFTVNPEDVSIAIGLKKGSDLKDDFDEYLNTLTAQYKNDLMAKMVKLANDDTATYTIDYEPSTSTSILKVGMECAYTPFNWTQNTNANGAVPIANVPGKFANGYDVQIAAKLAAALDMKLEVYQIAWESLILGVQAEEFDAIIAGMSPTAERMTEIDFTVPYYSSNLVIVTKEGSSIASYTSLADLDKAGVKIAAQPGTFHLTALEEQTDNLTVVSSYNDFVDMQMALEAGLIDGYVAEEPTAMAFC